MRRAVSRNRWLLAGGAFTLRRASMAACNAPPARGIVTSQSQQYIDGISLEEAPFGNAPTAESENEADKVNTASAEGTVLFGLNKIREYPAAKKPSAASLGPVRWIGSTSHSGDYTRASLQQPTASSCDSVWASIVAACREDPARLSATISSLYELYSQSQVTPPMPALNSLLSLCSSNGTKCDDATKLGTIIAGSVSSHQQQQQRHHVSQ